MAVVEGLRHTNSPPLLVYVSGKTGSLHNTVAARQQRTFRTKVWVVSDGRAL